MVHVGGSQGNPPGFVNTNQLNQLNQLAASGYGFPPGLASLAGFNPAAFLQSSKFTFLIIFFYYDVITEVKNFTWKQIFFL